MDNVQSGQPFPVILQASEVQFPPAGRLAFPRVESRMVLLCRAGRGTVNINRGEYQLSEESVFLLPWGHSIAYSAGAVDPFLVGGAHLVPVHDVGRPVRATIPHDPRHELAGCAWRHDDPGLADNDVITLTVRDTPDLVAVTRYAIEVFTHETPPVDVMRALGTLVAHELRMLRNPRTHESKLELPADLRRVTGYVDRSLHAVLTVRTLADVAGYSEATLTRRFRTYLGTSPMTWVISRRMRYAAELLRTTSIPVAQVARRCGIEDPYYFSRLFRAHHGESPTGWRNSQHVL